MRVFTAVEVGGVGGACHLGATHIDGRLFGIIMIMMKSLIMMLMRMVVILAQLIYLR